MQWPMEVQTALHFQMYQIQCTDVQNRTILYFICMNFLNKILKSLISILNIKIL